MRYLSIIIVALAVSLASQPRCEAACGLGLLRRVVGVERRQARRANGNGLGLVRGPARANGAGAGF